MAQQPLNLETVAVYTGKLNRQEKQLINNLLSEGKSLGEVLDEIAIFREGVTLDLTLAQDHKNSNIKNVCFSKFPLDLKRMSAQKDSLNPAQQLEAKKKEIRSKTDEFINLQNNKKNKKQK